MDGPDVHDGGNELYDIIVYTILLILLYVGSGAPNTTRNVWLGGFSRRSNKATIAPSSRIPGGRLMIVRKLLYSSSTVIRAVELYYIRS